MTATAGDFLGTVLFAFILQTLLHIAIELQEDEGLVGSHSAASNTDHSRHSAIILYVAKAVGL